jgi:kynurenine 3-monooxygenase
MFEELNTKELVLDFFKREFKDSVPLIGEEKLLEEYFNNPRGSLISIKVTNKLALQQWPT